MTELNDGLLQQFFTLSAGESRDEQLELFKKLEKADFDTNTDIVKIGDEGDDGLYIITEGDAEVIDSSGEVINELHAGDYFGEMALLMGEGRTMTVHSTNNMKTVRIPRETYEQLVAENPKNQGYLFGNLYKKLNDRYNKILELMNIRRRFSYLFASVLGYMAVIFFMTLMDGAHVGLERGTELFAIIKLVVSLALLLGMVFGFKMKAEDFGIKPMKAMDWALSLVAVGTLAAVTALRILIRNVFVGEPMLQAMPSVSLNSLSLLFFCILIATWAINILMLRCLIPVSLGVVGGEKRGILAALASAGTITLAAAFQYKALETSWEPMVINTALGFVAAFVLSLIVIRRKSSMPVIVAYGVQVIISMVMYLIRTVPV